MGESSEIRSWWDGTLLLIKVIITCVTIFVLWGPITFILSGIIALTAFTAFVCIGFLGLYFMYILIVGGNTDGGKKR